MAHALADIVTVGAIALVETARSLPEDEDPKTMTGLSESVIERLRRSEVVIADGQLKDALKHVGDHVLLASVSDKTPWLAFFVPRAVRTVRAMYLAGFAGQLASAIQLTHGAMTAKTATLDPEACARVARFGPCVFDALKPALKRGADEGGPGTAGQPWPPYQQLKLWWADLLRVFSERIHDTALPTWYSSSLSKKIKTAVSSLWLTKEEYHDHEIRKKVKHERKKKMREQQRENAKQQRENAKQQRENSKQYFEDSKQYRANSMVTTNTIAPPPYVTRAITPEQAAEFLKRQRATVTSRRVDQHGNHKVEKVPDRGTVGVITNVKHKLNQKSSIFIILIGVVTIALLSILTITLIRVVARRKASQSVAGNHDPMQLALNDAQSLNDKLSWSDQSYMGWYAKH